MFGPILKITMEKACVTLRPMSKEEVVGLKDGLSKISNVQWTSMLHGFTKENEESWYDSVYTDSSKVVWGIVPKGETKPIGDTVIANINPVNGSCSTGIAIAYSTWQGKGLGSAAHLGRTWYAANILNRITIRSEVVNINEKSYKALLRVGYTHTGEFPAGIPKFGKWHTIHTFCWINPAYETMIFPNGTPEKYKEGIKKAKIALELANRVVEY